MGVWRAVDERPRGPFEGDPATLQLAKAHKFACCAELFRPDASTYPRAIRSMLTPCPIMSSCPTPPAGMKRMASEALDWLRLNLDAEALASEFAVLYGGRDWTGSMPLIPPCACSYLSGPSDGTVSDVLASYDAAGFVPRTEGDRCPAHISNELDFMAARLIAASAGDQASLEDSRTFMVDHLFPWGVVFAAATYARAVSPPVRFAGAILEQLLFCERDHAQARESSYNMLRESQISQGSSLPSAETRTRLA